MKHAALITALLWLMPLDAAITRLTVSGATTTQAIVSYTAPDTSACVLEVSENSNFTPVVNDVDPVKFSGSNLDTRPGNVTDTDGLERTFIIGKRAAETALDNRKYSRALQAYTAHYFRITCPSTGDTATGRFQTKNIKLGNTYANPLPLDPNNPGEYAWPTLSNSDRTQQIVDPLTGALIRRVTLPQDRYLHSPYRPTDPPVAMTLARSTGWTNPNGALGTGGAVIRGNNTATLFLSPYGAPFFLGSGGQRSLPSYASNQFSVNYFQFSATATISGCAGAEDCKISVCLSLDGATCYAGGTSYEQVLTTTPTTYVFGTQGVDLWQSAGNRPPSGPELANRSGTVTCNGSASVAWVSGDPFNILWGNGSTINIAGTDYTISAVTGLDKITLSGVCPTGVNVAYIGTNFGVLIRKKTNSADTVTIQNSAMRVEVSVLPFISFSGAFDICGPKAVLGPSGNLGFNCAINQLPVIYWVDGTTGEAHPIARALNNACGGFDSVLFDGVDPDMWYCGGTSPNKIKYYGNHGDPVNTATPGRFEEGEQLPTCDGTHSNQPCVVHTNMTPGTSLSTLANQFDTTFQADRFLNQNFVGVENQHLIYRYWRGNANSLGWTIVFDPYATSNGEPGNAGCVGGGNPGCVIAAQASWKSPKTRWCLLKSNSPMSTPGWLEVGPYYGGSLTETAAGRGPFISTVTGGGLLSAVVDAAGGPTDCPANAFGVTGKQCTTVTVDGEPRDPSPCVASVDQCHGALESGLPGEFGNAAVGDYFSNQSDFNGEWMRLIQKNGNTWTFQRKYAATTAATTAANPMLFAICNSVPANHPVRGAAAFEWFWNYTADPHSTNITGNTVLNDAYSVASHYYWQNLTSASPYWLNNNCNAVGDAGCYQTRTGTDLPTILSTPPTANPQVNPAFAGKRGSALANNTQSHPAGVGLYSPPGDREFFLDGRPFNGGPLSGWTPGTEPINTPGTLPFGGQLWKFSSAQIPALDRKFMPTFAFTGRMALKDISSPATGNVIGTGAADAYKYCVAYQANECRTGSGRGDVYVNAPYVTKPYCASPGQATPGADDFDICVGNNAMVYNSVTEIGLKHDDHEGNGGKYHRVLTNALARNRLLSVFWHPNALANARWILIDSNYGADGFRTEILAVKVPPPQLDSIDRSNFYPVNVPVTIVPPGADNAVVEFGYGEYGDPGAYYCTSRAESCAVGQPGGGDPFLFETSEAALLAGAPCSSGCTISVPAISQRVLYGRVVYRDAGKVVVARSAPFAVAVP